MDSSDGCTSSEGCINGLCWLLVLVFVDREICFKLLYLNL